MLSLELTGAPSAQLLPSASKTSNSERAKIKSFIRAARRVAVTRTYRPRKPGTFTSRGVTPGLGKSPPV